MLCLFSLFYESLNSLLAARLLESRLNTVYVLHYKHLTTLCFYVYLRNGLRNEQGWPVGENGLAKVYSQNIYVKIMPQ